jgi:unspecific monooxygenase
MYRMLFIIVRQALAADRLAGCEVPPGLGGIIAIRVLHRHRRRWNAPSRSIPTSFLPGASVPDGFAFHSEWVPGCVGALLAMTEATLVLADLARRYRIGLADDRPVLPVGMVTASQVDGPVPLDTR